MNASDTVRYAANVRRHCDAILEVEPPIRWEELDRRCGHDLELRRQLEALLTAVAAFEEAASEYDLPDFRLQSRAARDRFAAVVRQILAAFPDRREAFIEKAFETRESAQEAFKHLLVMEERRPGYLSLLIEGPAADFETARDSMIGRHISHYKILEFLGRGGMGVVYRARDLRLDRDVALKFLPSFVGSEAAAKRRFIREARAASALDHPNIGSVYDIDEIEEGGLFIAMACYAGETLKEKISRGPVGIEEATDIAVQITSALSAAHGRGIVHRDVKPGNVIITEDGLVKLIDFGLAKSRELPDVTKSGSTIGTLAYMSPEQVRGEEADSRSDIWSTGVLLYEMLAGRRPFDADYDHAVQYAILHETPTPLTNLRPETPPFLERIVTSALQKSPDLRYQRVDEMLADLHEAPEAVKAPLKVGRLRYGVGAVIATVCLAAAVYLVTFVSGQPAEPDDRKMMAVIPFRNLGLEDDAHFADGITEEITSRLAGISGLGVISSSSAMRYRETEKETREIGDELGVEYLLRGSIRWQRSPDGPDRVRVIPQLIQVSDDRQIWSDIYDRDLIDILAVQAELSEAVIRELNVTLSEPESQALTLIETDNPDAYRAYVAGRGYESNKEFDDAIQEFERAVHLDSTFVKPYTFLVGIYARLHYYTGDESLLARATRALQSAERLAPENPEVVLAGAYYDLNVTRNYSKALETFERAMELLPNDSRPVEGAGFIFWRQGQFEAAAASFTRAATLDPLYTHAMNLSWTYGVMREYALAERYSQMALGHHPSDRHGYAWEAILGLLQGDTAKARAQLEEAPTPSSHGEFVFAHYFLNLAERDYEAAGAWLDSTDADEIQVQRYLFPTAWMKGYAYQLLGDPARAEAAFLQAADLMEQKVASFPNDFAYRGALGLAYASLGRREDAVREGERATEIMSMSKDRLTGTLPMMHLANIYAIVGARSAAIRTLDELLSMDSWMSVAWIRLDPRWDSLRDDPEFERMLARHEKSGEPADRASLDQRSGRGDIQAARRSHVSLRPAARLLENRFTKQLLEFRDDLRVLRVDILRL